MMMCLYTVQLVIVKMLQRNVPYVAQQSRTWRHVYGIHLPYWYDSQLACLHCQTYIGSVHCLRGQHLDVHASASYSLLMPPSISKE